MISRRKLYFTPDYVGSKNVELELIGEYLDKNNLINKNSIFIDVFGGSGLVGLYIADKYKIPVVYNELNIELINFFFQLKHNYNDFLVEFNKKIQLFEAYKWKLRRGLFVCNDEEKKMYDELKCLYNDYRDEKDLTSLQKAVRYYIISKMAFRGEDGKLNSGINIGANRAFRLNTDTSLLLKTAQLLQNITISNDDYKICMEKYKDLDAILYLDPPYLTKKTATYKHMINLDDYDYLISLYYQNIKSSIMLHIGFTPYCHVNKLEEFEFHMYDKYYNSSKNRKNQLERKSFPDYHIIYLNKRQKKIHKINE